MGYVLRDNLRCCLANGRVAFLDLAADRYFCLPEALDEAFRDLMATRKGDARALQPLIRSNVLRIVPGAESHWSAPDISPARASLDILAFAAPNPPALWRALTSHAISLLSQNTRKLDISLAALKRALDGRSVRQPDGPQDYGHHLRAFLATERIISNQNQCLRRSMALARYLGSCRWRTRFVIGVKMAPFGAHAWVQCHHIVLNDSPDIVGAYTPILAI